MSILQLVDTVTERGCITQTQLDCPVRMNFFENDLTHTQISRGEIIAFVRSIGRRAISGGPSAVEAAGLAHESSGRTTTACSMIAVVRRSAGSVELHAKGRRHFFFSPSLRTFKRIGAFDDFDVR